jgi:hypothetical protein
MAMILFTALNGAGVVFLLYVLVQFWIEGHRPNKAGARRHGTFSRGANVPEVFLLRYSPLPEGIGTGTPLIHFPTSRKVTQNSEGGAPAQQERRFSARQA